MGLLANLFIGLVLVACYVDAEVCTVDSDCMTTTCTGSSTVICQHPDGSGITQDGGLCTCQSTDECTTQSDCFDKPDLNCPNAARHCYDNKCICDRFPIGRRSIL